ncbi:MAG: hypothetical protein CMM48_07100 [Rhodospirillaceae bacterium]|nr:hypothetical protein [Rhodospirillaceae bacterium]
METPDQHDHDKHIEHHRRIEDPPLKLATVGEKQPENGEKEIKQQHEKNRSLPGLVHMGLGRNSVENAKGHDDDELKPSDKYFAICLLALDYIAHAIGHLTAWFA